jgi:transcriptional regulator with XRE-family HTH domain
MPNTAKFGRLLRELRTKAGKTMGDLARLLKVSVSYVSDVERGARAPLVRDKIISVAAFLQADANPLLIAAAQSRGAFELDANVNSRARELGAALTRTWSDLSDEQLDKISRVVAGEE